MVVSNPPPHFGFITNVPLRYSGLLIKANQKRFSYDYQIGQQVLKLAYKPHKLEPRALSGPHTIEQVHTNGTVTIRLSPYVVERISLRRIKPYRHT